MNDLSLNSAASASVSRGSAAAANPPVIKGRFKVEHFRDGNKIGEYLLNNGIVDVGIHTLFDVFFRAGTQITTWYLGLIDNSGFTGLSNSDTMSSHSGWSESTIYSNANRPTWNSDAPASRQITNSTTVDFNINASGTIKGIFVTSNNTKGGTSGTLWATALFSSTVTVANGDTLKITYTVSG